MAEQMPFGVSAAFAGNSEQRCPCVLLLDTSGSMGEVVADSGRDLGYTIQQDGQTYRAVSGGTTRIDLLNAGLRAYHTDLIQDSMASLRVEVSVITFGGTVQTVTPFVTAHDFTPPTLTASGDTPMGAAIFQAIDAVTERKRIYKQNGIEYLRPWIILITDGEPTDAWKPAAARVKEGESEAKREFTFFTLGVARANFDVLERIGTRPPKHLDETKFRELFEWLSNSQKRASQSKPGQEEKVQLPPTKTWETP